MKKALPLLLVTVFLSRCVTIQPLPPDLYIESLPQSITATLSLEERIQAEEAWKSLKQGQISKAEKRMARLGSSNPISFVGLGYANILKNAYPASEQFFRSALEAQPDMVLAHLGLVQVYQKTNQEDLAFNELREVLKREHNHPWAKPLYDNLKAKKTEESSEEAKQALARGDREKSKEAYLKALHYSPESIEAHLALAEIYKKEKKWQNALIHLKAASSSSPENAAALRSYAELLFQTEQFSKSLDAYEQLLELDPKNQQAKDQVENLKNMLGIFEIPSQYDAIPASEAVTREGVAALLAVKFKGILEEPASKPEIIVDISASWASRFIIKTTSLGLLEVYSNHSFQPKKVVARGEMAEIIFRTINYLKQKGYRLIPQIPPDKIPVADVTSDHSYYQPIIQVLSYQIMDLPPDKMFKPDQSLSGVEAIKILDVLLALVK